MSDTWFEALFGFPEGPYAETKSRFRLEGETLVALAPDGERRFGAGTFATPSLASLRAMTPPPTGGSPTVHHEVIGDVLETHALPENEGALFQVASQLNCLEFADPRELPENGVTQYAFDPTQGPACALAAAAATVVRNYFVPVNGRIGQTRDHQIDNLAALQTALGDAGALIEVRNGYTFSTPEGLQAIGEALARVDREALLGELRIGLQRDVEVTFERRFSRPGSPQRVDQAFCSALSCGYASGSLALWRPLAKLVLDGAYEATLRAAVIRRNPRVWLTFLGGGAFGNEKTWIAAAIGRALRLVEGHALDVRIAHHRGIDDEMVHDIDEARRG
ncbi:MAG: hypothetical protein JJ863_04025 [Deltaproteobacteria bacterium]|nr:hypothetical protein [Deltaproteobacteria bacterium]